MKSAWGVGLVWAVFMAVGLWLVATRLSVHNELGDLLPAGSTATQRLLLTQVRTGLAGRLILLALKGENADELAAISKELGAALRGSNHFDIVANGAQSWSPEEQALLFQSRYLLSRTVDSKAFSVEALHAALEQRLDDLRSPLASLLKPVIPTDPTGEFFRILQAWSGWDAPAKHRGVWMSADRTQALLVAETRAQGFDADAQESVQREIRSTFRRLAADRTASVQLLMSGPGVFTVEIQRTIEAEVWWLSIVAATLVFLFLYASYRSLVLVLLSLIPLSSGVFAGMVAVNDWFGFIHGITLGFGITLLGVADDYPIHLFSHLTGRHSAQSVMRDIWPTMRLGVLTTAIGFSSLLLAGFPALAQLGLFAIAGLLTAALVTRWVLPVFVPSGFSPREAPPSLLMHVDRLAKGKLLVPVAVVLATSGLIWSDTALWETDLASLSPLSEEKKQLDQRLRTELGAPDVRDLLVIEGSTEEDVLQRAEVAMPKLEGLRESGALIGYEMASRYLPSRRMQQERQQALPARRELERDLNVAVKGLPFAPGLFVPFLVAVETARSQLSLDRASFRGTALGMKIESLLFEQQGRWIAVAPLRGVADRAQLKEAIAGWGDSAVAYVDLKAESNQLMTAYRDRTLHLLGWGTAAIALALAIGLRSVTRLWRVLAPILCALVVVAAILNFSGESLSLFHVATFLLVMGLGLDYALFFNRPEGTEAERSRTIFGLLICSATTLLVFGVLAFSTIPVLHAIGMTAACGSFFSLLFAGMMAETAKENHAA